MEILDIKELIASGINKEIYKIVIKNFTDELIIKSTTKDIEELLNFVKEYKVSSVINQSFKEAAILRDIEKAIINKVEILFKKLEKK